jgi:hypothetical protein
MVDLLKGKLLWVVFNIRVIGFYIQKKCSTNPRLFCPKLLIGFKLHGLALALLGGRTARTKRNGTQLWIKQSIELLVRGSAAGT